MMNIYASKQSDYKKLSSCMVNGTTVYKFRLNVNENTTI